MINLNLPIKNNDYKNLKVGDQVLLNGTIYTARDQAHKRFMDALPIDLVNQAIYYVGPTFNSDQTMILSAGPTTSSRMDDYASYLYDNGLKVTIGKGRRSAEVKKSIEDNEALYLMTYGGAGAYLGRCIKSMKLVCYKDLLSEGVFELVVEDFPCIVAIDSHGNSLF